MANEKDLTLIVGSELQFEGIDKASLEKTVRTVKSSLEKNQAFQQELKIKNTDGVLKELRAVKDAADNIKQIIASIDVGGDKFTARFTPIDTDTQLDELKKQIKELELEYDKLFKTSKQYNSSNKSGMISVKSNKQLLLDLENIQKRIIELRSEYNKLEKEANSSSTQMELSSTTVVNRFNEQSSVIKEARKIYIDLTKAQENYNKALRDNNPDSIERTKDVLKESEKKLQEFINTNKQYQNEINKLSEGYVSSKKQEDSSRLEGARKELDKLLKSLDLYTDKLKGAKAESDFKIRTESIKKYEAEIINVNNQLDKLIAKNKELSNEANFKRYEIMSGTSEAGVKATDQASTRNQQQLLQKNNEAYRQYISNLKEIYKLERQLGSGEKYITNERQEAISILKSENVQLQNTISSTSEQITMNRENVKTLKDVTDATNKFLQVQNGLNSTNNNLWSNFSDGMKDAIARVLNYTIAYRTLWTTIQMFQKSMQIIRELNATMTDIQLVTGGTAKETAQLASDYADLGQKMGATTTDVAEAANEYIRQGKSVAETNQLIKQSLTLAKIGDMETAEATKFLTSAMQAYKLEVQEVAHVTDALSAVDLVAATSSKDIAIGLQQSANSASLAGVEFEKLVGYLAATQETTQKSAQVIGTSMKSIFSRMQNVKAGKFLDDEGEAINDVEKVLSSLGIELRKNKDEWNSVGDVLDQVNERWDEFTATEKNAVATSIAGFDLNVARTYRTIEI